MIAEPIKKMLSVVSERGSKQNNCGAGAHTRHHVSCGPGPTSLELRRPGAPRPQSETRQVQGAIGANPPANFFDVRLHPDAAEVTVPLQARAVTRGQDVYFHPGQFQPGTPHGEALIAHELAHTLQTRHAAGAGGGSASFVSQPGDAFERNADALVRGETTHALAAPAGAALRGPFDNESATDRARREELLRSIQNAENNLIRLLSTGGLISLAEVEAQRGGANGVVVPANSLGTPNETFFSYANRDALIRRIIRSLMDMATQYRQTPIPSALPPATQDPGNNPPSYSTVISSPGGISSYGGRDPGWSQLQAAYELYRISHGQVGSAYDSDWYYLDPSIVILPGAAHGAPRIRSGIQLGIYMVVPDIEHEPLRYWRLTGTSPTPRGSTIVEFWHDDLGYYYMNHGQRIDVPDPHTTP